MRPSAQTVRSGHKKIITRPLDKSGCECWQLWTRSWCIRTKTWILVVFWSNSKHYGTILSTLCWDHKTYFWKIYNLFLKEKTKLFLWSALAPGVSHRNPHVRVAAILSVLQVLTRIKFTSFEIWDTNLQQSGYKIASLTEIQSKRIWTVLYARQNSVKTERHPLGTLINKLWKENLIPSETPSGWLKSALTRTTT